MSSSVSVSSVSSMMIVPATAEVAADGTRDSGGGGYEEAISSKELVMVVIQSRGIEEVMKCWC